MEYRSWHSRAFRSAVLVSCSVVGLGLASCFAVLVGVGLATMVPGPTSLSGNGLVRASQPDETQRYSKVLYETDSLRDLQNGKVFKRLKKSNNRAADRELEQLRGPRVGLAAGGTYRTVCVRLCDGYYFPISAATTRSRFKQDARACQSRCGAETRLFDYPNVGGSPETMVDSKGRDYASLAKAFLYRTSYDASCKCRAHPWEPDAVKAHQTYASADWQKKARRVALINARKHRKQRRRYRALARARAKALQNGQLRGSLYVQGQPGTGSAAAAIPVSTTGAVLVNGRVVVRQKLPGQIMSLGVKPRKMRRPKARYRARSRKRNWKSSVFAGSEN